MSQLILQPFFRFSYVTGSSLNVTWVCSFSNLSITSPTPQLIPQSFCCFTYDTAHSPILPLLHLRHSSFSNPSVPSPTPQLILQSFRASPTPQLILQSFRCFTYVTAHSTILPLLHLRHISFFNPSVALPTSQLILQPFRCFTYVTVHSPTLLSLLLRHRVCSFSNLSVTSPTSQLILQPFFHFYVTSSTLNSPGEPPML